MTDFLIIPTTEAPSQFINVTLNEQNCQISLYTKSINIPNQEPMVIITDPPVYENANPVFLDLYLNNTILLGAVLCLNQVLIVRDTYFGFIGDFMIVDTEGNSDPYGVSVRLPPANLRNLWQRSLPLTLAGKAPTSMAGRIPGMGTRFLLLYLPDVA